MKIKKPKYNPFNRGLKVEKSKQFKGYYRLFSPDMKDILKYKEAAYIAYPVDGLTKLDAERIAYCVNLVTKTENTPKFKHVMKRRKGQ